MGFDAIVQYNLSRFLGSFLIGTISDSVLQLVLRPTLMQSLLGVYSGVFALYLRHCTEKRTNSAIFFFSLCLLSILSGATTILDTVVAVYGIFVPTTVRSIRKVQFQYHIFSRSFAFWSFTKCKNSKSNFFFFQVHQRIIIMCLVLILGIRVY